MIRYLNVHGKLPKKFYCNTNIILGRFSTSAPVNVLLKLIDSQPVPHLLYVIFANTLSLKDIKSLSYACNSILKNTSLI